MNFKIADTCCAITFTATNSLMSVAFHTAPNLPLALTSIKFIERNFSGIGEGGDWGLKSDDGILCKKNEQ